MLFWEEVVGTVWVDECAKGFVFSPHFCFSSPQYSCSDCKKKPISWGLFVVFIVDFLSDQTNNRFNAFKGRSTKRCEVSGYRKHSQRNRTAASSKATKPSKDSFLKHSFNDSITAAVQFLVKTSQWWIMAESLLWRNFSFGFSNIKMCGKTEVGTSKQSERRVSPSLCYHDYKLSQCHCGYMMVSTIGIPGKNVFFFPSAHHPLLSFLQI